MGDGTAVGVMLLILAGIAGLVLAMIYLIIQWVVQAYHDITTERFILIPDYTTHIWNLYPVAIL